MGTIRGDAFSRYNRNMYMKAKKESKGVITHWQVWHCGVCVYDNLTVTLAEHYRKQLTNATKKPVYAK